jgi:hypothetical protein
VGTRAPPRHAVHPARISQIEQVLPGGRHRRSSVRDGGMDNVARFRGLSIERARLVSVRTGARVSRIGLSRIGLLVLINSTSVGVFYL